ncbi:uncharacterized protein LOC106130713 [Amyelois transitella]|uniref:uncharacterized protein LOC106130713 n=1 Tax=Amyelois transitella TaxID=680683 RepID=UPI00067A8AE9|nr:uncharacterized protein LOC106130713 [Amyelois transitella]
MWRTLALFAFASVCLALPAQDSSHTDNDLEGLGDCLRKDSTSCLKYKFFSYVDKMLGQKDSFALTDGVTVVKATDAPAETGAPRSLDPVSRLKSYFETHSLRVEVKGSDVIDAVSSAGRALEDTVTSFVDDGTEEGRGKKKKAAKMLGPLIAALALKMMALLPLAIGAIALIAGKALLIGKLALVLSAIIGLKKLLSQQKHVTYEVVAHPHHSSSHTSSHDYGGTSGYGGDSGGYSSGGSSSGHGGGWGRSMEAQSLAYSAQKPQ